MTAESDLIATRTTHLNAALEAWTAVWDDALQCWHLTHEQRGEPIDLYAAEIGEPFILNAMALLGQRRAELYGHLAHGN